MFKLIDDPTFTHEVEVMTPVDGGFRTDTFQATFKVMSTAKMAEFPLTVSFSEDNAEFLRGVLTGFEGIVGDDDKDLPYNHELRDKVLAQPNAQMALMQTYLRAISKVKQGN